MEICSADDCACDISLTSNNLIYIYNLHHDQPFFKKHPHAGSIVNTTLPACYIYILLHSSRISFGYIVPCYQYSIAVPSASKSFERVLCCCTRNCCWFMLFVLLIYLSATCFAFASGLANILASNL